MKWETLTLSLFVITIAVSAFLFQPRASNCGGNSAALNCVKQYALAAQLEIHENPQRAFRVHTAIADQQQELSQVARNHWIKSARFLVCTNLINESDLRAPRLLIVCDTPYSNVPQRRIGSSPPTHAAAFSDGTTKLLTTAEFAALDLSRFDYLDRLIPPRGTNIVASHAR